MMTKFLCTVIFVATFMGSTDAQQLPLADGVYLKNTKLCAAYHAGELDFIDFEVEQSGRSFGFIEVGCLVYSVKKMRKSRYHVKSDCTEGGEVYQKQMFLDLVGNGKIRIDGGKIHTFCKHRKLSKKPQALIEKWALYNEDCRGGSGDDPATDIACGKRDDLVEKLHSKEWCYGKGSQSGADYSWHLCDHFSIKQ